MKTRNPKRLRFKQLTEWPPVWKQIDGMTREPAVGAVGVLESVHPSRVNPCATHIVMIHNDNAYIATIQCQDSILNEIVIHFLIQHRGRPLSKIGELSVPTTPSSTRSDIPAVSTSRSAPVSRR